MGPKGLADPFGWGTQTDSMETTEVKRVTEELAAKSQQVTLDELRDRGRKRVKVIKGADVASMITESVYRVLHDTQMLSDADMEVLVDRGAAEFKQVFAERQRGIKQAEQSLNEVRIELKSAQSRVKELEALLVEAQSGAPAPAPASDSTTTSAASAEGPTAELMMQMMQEMADMKASFAQQQGGGAEGGAGMVEALDKISSNLDSRLEKFGRKMGISNAVEGEDVNLASLFNDDQEAKLESNMGDVQVKKKTGGGIAGNLERLRSSRATARAVRRDN